MNPPRTPSSTPEVPRSPEWGLVQQRLGVVEGAVDILGQLAGLYGDSEATSGQADAGTQAADQPSQTHQDHPQTPTGDDQLAHAQKQVDRALGGSNPLFGPPEEVESQ